jgi:hypothetical protein
MPLTDAEKEAARNATYWRGDYYGVRDEHGDMLL